MSISVLIVDSDGKALASLQRKLRKDYDAQIALGHRMGLQRMAEEGPFAVVLAEYSMQPMDGLTFLDQVRERWPDTTRILISRDMVDTTELLRAINEVKVFHLLSNPCAEDTLLKVVENAVLQYEHNVVRSQEMRQQHALFAKAFHEIVCWLRSDMREVISPVLPMPRTLCVHLDDPYPLVTETALLSSIVGMISMPKEILAKVISGVTLSDEENMHFAQHPTRAAEFIQHLPQLHAVVELLRAYAQVLSQCVIPGKTFDQTIPTGAVLLALIMDYRFTSMNCEDVGEIITRLRTRQTGYPADYLMALENVLLSMDHSEEEVSLAGAKAGMVLTRAVTGIRDDKEVVFVPEGYELSRTTLVFLRQSAKHNIVREPLYVRKIASHFK